MKHPDPIPKTSALEKISEQSVAINAASAIGGTLLPELAPVFALIPALADSAAGKRQSARIFAAIRNVDTDLQNLREQVDAMNDEQFQLSSDLVVQILATTNQEKLNLLRQAIVNNVTDAAVAQNSAEQLARLIRDISTSEASLVVDLFRFAAVAIVDDPDFSVPDGMYRVTPGTTEARQVEGLIHLGLLQSHVSSWDYTRYEWTPLAAKLITLIRPTGGPAQGS